MQGFMGQRLHGATAKVLFHVGSVRGPSNIKRSGAQTSRTREMPLVLYIYSAGTARRIAPDRTQAHIVKAVRHKRSDG